MTLRECVCLQVEGGDGGAGPSDQPEDVYRQWLRRQYDAYVAALLALLHRQAVKPATQVGSGEGAGRWQGERKRGKGEEQGCVWGAGMVQCDWRCCIGSRSSRPHRWGVGKGEGGGRGLRSD